jgi:hypothetical protein
MRSSRDEGGARVVREKLEVEGGDGNCERQACISHEWKMTIPFGHGAAVLVLCRNLQELPLLHPP